MSDDRRLRLRKVLAEYRALGVTDRNIRKVVASFRAEDEVSPLELASALGEFVPKRAFR